MMNSCRIILVVSAVWVASVTAWKVKTSEEGRVEGILEERRLQEGGDLAYLIPILNWTNIDIHKVEYVAGSNVQLGSFYTDSGLLGMDSGVLLSTGDSSIVFSSDQGEIASTDCNGTGYAPLDNLLSALGEAESSYDAVAFKVTFSCAGTAGGELEAKYVWASEDYHS
jgi:hypothetical protein